MVAIKYMASDEFSSLIRQMHQAVEGSASRQFFGFSPTEAWRPSVNLYETTDTFLICVDLAGMEKEQIDVQIDRGNVVLRGARTSPLPPGGVKAVAVHLMEIDHGSFCRTVEIPANVDEKRIGASYLQGMLWITLPKLRTKTPRNPPR